MVSAKPYIWFPSARQAPADVLRALRAIEPKVELVWLRRGAWALGTYSPDPFRQAEAKRSLKALNGPGLTRGYSTSPQSWDLAVRAHGDRMAMTWLKAQGYLHQQTFDMRRHSEAAVFGVMENWLREAKWVQQHEYEEAWRALEAAQVENHGEKERIADLIDHARLREAYRMEYKRPVSSRVGVDIRRLAHAG